MRRCFLFLVILSGFLSISWSQDSVITKKLSPFFQRTLRSQQYIHSQSDNYSPLAVKHIIQSDGDTLYPVIIYTSSPQALRDAGIQVRSVFSQFVTAAVTTNQVRQLSLQNQVRFIREAKRRKHCNDVAAGLVGARALQDSAINNTSYQGDGVLVCDIDTGIDWKHKDFRDPTDTTKSRIAYLWDQTLTAKSSETVPSKGYGVLYTQDQINNELDGSPTKVVRSKDTDGHATHVTGILAGNGASASSKKFAGIAPKATILAVKTDFYDSDIIDGMTWADSIATVLGQPLVINLSLGGQLTAHDGTAEDEQVIDTIAAKAGRAVAVAAGNDGEDDIHYSGAVAAHSSATITCTVPSYTPNSDVENDYVYLDVWFSEDDSITATVTSPNSKVASATMEGYGYSNSTDGYIEVDNYLSTANNKREIGIYILDYTNASYVPKTGTWKITFTNSSSHAAAYHGWIDSEVGSTTATVTGADNTYCVSTPGNAANAITVGSYASRWFWKSMDGSTYYLGTPNTSDYISSWSSQGPRTDGVQKPDIAAPGECLISTLSSSISSSSYASYIVQDKKHWIMSGTSMSTPVVAGCCALLLQQNANLTGLQIKNYLTSTATSDDMTGTSLPDCQWGYGKVDVYKAMKQLQGVATSFSRSMLAYDQWDNSSYVQFSKSEKYAVRITPQTTGILDGVLFHDYTVVNLKSPLQVEIWNDNGSGLPGALYAGPFSVDTGSIISSSWNYVDLTSNNIDVTAGTSYHVVLYHNTSDTAFSLLQENASVSNRSSRYANGAWSTYAYDLRIRALVNGTPATTETTSTTSPLTFSVAQNYPNPFNPTTTISFCLPQKNHTTVKIYDCLGREITTLVNSDLESGYHSATLNAARYASGVYFYRVISGKYNDTKKMILLK